MDGGIEKKKRKNLFMDTDNSVVMAGEAGGWRWKRV